jgi:pyruvate/2-oxoglutarate/acetoin dehydrogenase E1 component
MGGEILREVIDGCFEYLDRAPRVLANKNIPIPYAKVLENAAIPQKTDIIETVKEMLKKSKRNA